MQINKFKYYVLLLNIIKLDMDEFLKIHDLKLDALNNPKICFRYLCWSNIKNIEKLHLPKIIKNLNNEVVLIEFRNLPHIEFLLRNAILKINKNSSWSFTIVCGNDNYSLINTIKNKIDKNIQIYKLNVGNLNQSEYSVLLTSDSFWNMFTGEKLLIMQEDSFIFRDNINDFLEYDYIGAPWFKHQNDTQNCVGNGGLSLRSKNIMIKILKTKNIESTVFNHSTKKYMKCTKMEFPPEDVYFSKTMQELKIGKISDYETASKFSSESIYNELSFGGHCFWKGCSQWKVELNKNINSLYKQFKIKECNLKQSHMNSENVVKIILLSEINVNLKNKCKYQIVDTPFDYISNKKIENIMQTIIDNYNVNIKDYKCYDNKNYKNIKYDFEHDHNHDQIDLDRFIKKYQTKYSRIFNVIKGNIKKIFILIIFNNTIKEEQLIEFKNKFFKAKRDFKIVVISNTKPKNIIENIQYIYKDIKNIDAYKKFIRNNLNNLI